ncbi:MAG: HU family DNA-binding protein [Phycisphaerae bacterium]|nr:HU family DNA-binding protein [Phycisphaerae bacterium]MBT5366338.1 HU family DNA-binding protein [Phycisphaerae bacterium]MBT6269933.1 HU family DNA-binding protein [Phycisphaerae bacterium]MBT6282032.1 HU family DNA-binding protein [Phycisphaerae bacterium]
MTDAGGRAQQKKSSSKTRSKEQKVWKMQTITKKVLIDLISVNTKYKKADVGKIMNLVLDSIVIELGKGNRIELRNFGVFESTMRASRKAQNPKTLEPVQVPAKRVVKFKPGKVMKCKVEQSAVGNQGATIAMEMPVVETPTVVAKEPVAV